MPNETSPWAGETNLSTTNRCVGGEGLGEATTEREHREAEKE
jgi:hypothetical protein